MSDAVMSGTRAGGWIGGMIDAAARAFQFRSTGRNVDAAATPSAAKASPGKSRKIQTRAKGSASRAGTTDHRRSAAEVRRLTADGVDRMEIARRTGLAQDTIGLLINLGATAEAEAAEVAGRGTFFRILQARIGVAGQA